MEQPLAQSGACAWGCVPAEAFWPRMRPEDRRRALERTPGLKSLICAAFPYGPTEPVPGDLSLYARGADYHAVLAARLAPAAEMLAGRYPGCRFDFWADASPFPEVYAAALAGLGKLGRNGLLITPTAGSFVFLGFLATDAQMPATGGAVVSCRGCGACQKACPGGALRESFDPERCLSALTQKRGELTPAQQALVRRGGLLWGCDRCQLCCPENRGRTAPPLPEFAPLPGPGRADLALGDRAFRRSYAGRAFVWRGVQPLRRNAALLDQTEQGREDL